MPRKSGASNLPVQLPLLSRVPVVVLSAKRAVDAWKWVKRQISARPSVPTGICIYDLKLWGNGRSSTAITATSPFIDAFAHLYVASQFGDMAGIIRLANDDVGSDVIIPSGILDSDTRAVVASVKRFRHALSEHLAFWSCLATHKKLRPSDRFACTLPNYQPEDKGPDGLVLVAGPSPLVEIHSIKSSIKDPANLISSSNFRKHGKATRQKQLDDFWICAHEGAGLGRLDRLLEPTTMALGLTADQQFRMGLLARCGFNAVVVANYAYRGVNRFVGFDRITTDVNRCIVTYIPSRSWKGMAERVRARVRKLLVESGVW